MFEVEGVMYTQEQMYQGVKLANGNYLSHKRMQPPPRGMSSSYDGVHPWGWFDTFKSIKGKM